MHGKWEGWPPPSFPAMTAIRNLYRLGTDLPNLDVPTRIRNAPESLRLSTECLAGGRRSRFPPEWRREAEPPAATLALVSACANSRRDPCRVAMLTAPICSSLARVSRGASPCRATLVLPGRHDPTDLVQSRAFWRANGPCLVLLWLREDWVALVCQRQSAEPCH